MIIDHDMTICKMINEDIIIIKSGTKAIINGIVKGNVILEENSDLLIAGIVYGEVHIYQNSTCTIAGLVKAVMNHGGELKISGSVREIILKEPRKHNI